MLGWGLTVLALAAGLAAFVKAFFPEKKLRDIVKKKSLWWLLGGAAALAALDEVLPLLWAGYSTAAAFVKLAGGVAILGGTVTAAVRGEKRREREREEAEIEAMEEPKPETMEEARRPRSAHGGRDRGVSLLKKGLLRKGEPARRRRD